MKETIKRSTSTKRNVRSYTYSSISMWINQKSGKLMTATHNGYVHSIPPSEAKRMIKFLEKAIIPNWVIYH